ncbi:hypothetical protein PN36_09600 [Candidatus Thiomargarita nelsonii]|uniref:Uncharacterized protein n=1 Tax=Candidatus Thiomargarita nelsonii TaxID=1003181 RepID=A0A0A6P6H5_9GAMM|nr:hypothetical protein PN36_09600 [Candidatus Thiomargarita nelsonii]
MSVFLIAQTPRAGLRNHCFVVPESFLELTSRREVGERLSAAISQPQGDDYIAVSQTVEQIGSSRQGHEILVLVGLDVKQLSENAHKKVHSKLKDYLSQFEILVTQTIDWEKSGSDLFVQRRELEEWGQDSLFLGLPLKKSVMTAAKKHFILKKIGVGIATLLLLVIIFVSYLIMQQKENHIESTDVRIVEPDKFPYHKYNRLLPKACTISPENKKALAELSTLCQISKRIEHPDFLTALRESYCHDFLLKIEEIDNLNQETVQEFVTVGHHLQTELELDRLTDYSLSERVFTVVDIRNKIRALYKAFNHEPQMNKVCLPFFTDEDVEMASYLEKVLKKGEKPLIAYLALTPKKVVLEVERERKKDKLEDKLENLITQWELGSPTKQEKAKQELEQQLLKVCGKNHTDELIQCVQIEQVEAYQTELKMNQIVVFISKEEDKKQIYELLGFDKNDYFEHKLNLIVAIRQALRELDAAINGTAPQPVYLPLFSNEDARIINRLHEEIKKVEIIKTEKRLEGLKKIREMGQEMVKEMPKRELMTQVNRLFSEYQYPKEIKTYLSQQLKGFYEKSSRAVVNIKINRLIKSIDAVRYP